MRTDGEFIVEQGAGNVPRRGSQHCAPHGSNQPGFIERLRSAGSKQRCAPEAKCCSQVPERPSALSASSYTTGDCAPATHKMTTMRKTNKHKRRPTIRAGQVENGVAAGHRHAIRAARRIQATLTGEGRWQESKAACTPERRLVSRGLDLLPGAIGQREAPHGTRVLLAGRRRRAALGRRENVAEQPRSSQIIDLRSGHYKAK